MTSIQAVCVFLILSSHTTFAKTIAEYKRDVLDLVLPKNRNDILVGPGNTTSGVTSVEISMHVLGIDKLNEEKNEFTVRTFFRQTWKDYRLKYDSKGHFKHVVINDPKLIWTPDIFFSDEKKGQTFDITHPNVFIRLFPDGTVRHSTRVSLTIACPMNLRKYPFDSQSCEIRIGTYGTTIDDVVLLWRDLAPLTVSRIMTVPLFKLEKFVTTSGIISLSTGTYSYVTAYFYLIRTFNYYLYHIYIPSIMMTLLSWLPFWMNKNAMTGRILIGISVLLAYTLLIYDNNKHSAKVDYSTYMLTFTGTCLTFLAIALVETVAVHVSIDENKEPIKNCSATGETLDEENCKLKTFTTWIAKLSMRINRIDLIARFLMPIGFTIFCIIYFWSLCGFSDNTSNLSMLHDNKSSEVFVQKPQ